MCKLADMVEPIPWEYEPLDPKVTDWVPLLDTDPAEAFRVRARLERELKGPPANLNLNQIQRELLEARERLSDVDVEISELEQERFELQEKVRKMEHIFTQSRRRNAS